MAVLGRVVRQGIEMSLDAKDLLIEFAIHQVPIAKAVLELSRAMNYEKVVVQDDGSVLAAVILKAAEELRQLKGRA